MAFTQANFESLLCKLKNCTADLGISAVKNKTYGDDMLFCEKVPLMKKLYIIQYVLNWEYNTRYSECKTCLCDGSEYTDQDVLSCPQECLDEEGICLLAEYIDLLCSRVKGVC